MLAGGNRQSHLLLACAGLSGGRNKAGCRGETLKDGKADMHRKQQERPNSGRGHQGWRFTVGAAGGGKEEDVDSGQP